MTLKSKITLSALAIISPGHVSAAGDYQLGLAKETLAIPSDADQMLVLKGTLDPDVTTSPSDLVLDLNAGTVDSQNAPAAPFDQAAWEEAIGATGLNVDCDPAGFDTIYAIIIKCPQRLVVGTGAVVNTAWATGPFKAAGDAVETSHLVLTNFDGWAVAAADEISLESVAGQGESEFEVVVIGKKA